MFFCCLLSAYCQDSTTVSPVQKEVSEKLKKEVDSQSERGQKTGPEEQKDNPAVKSNPVKNKPTKPANPALTKPVEKKGCMDEIEAQNIEVVTCNEILSADSDISLRATIANGRKTIDGLNKRLRNCNKEFSKIYIRNAIKRIQSAIKNAEEATIDKKSLIHMNTVNEKKNLLLQKFDIERARGRPDFHALQETADHYRKLCGGEELKDSAKQVIKQMEKVIRRRGTVIGEDVVDKLDAHIKKNEVNEAVREYRYLEKNAKYLRILDLTVSSLELDHYASAITGIGGDVADSQNDKNLKSDINTEKVIIETSGQTNEMERELRGNAELSTKLINRETDNIMDDFNDLEEEVTADDEKPTSFVEIIMKAGEAKKEAMDSSSVTDMNKSE